MILLNAKYEAWRPFIERIPLTFEHEGREIYHLRNVIKVVTAPDGTELNVKRYHVPALPNRLIYSAGLRTAKGLRAYRYPTRLLACGIETPEPVAYIEERRCGLMGYSYFISMQCPYGHTLYDVKDMAAPDFLPLADAVADLAAKMHGQGILHRDFTPGNILWEPATGGGYRLSLVDINRMYFGPVSTAMGLRNLTRFWGPKAFTEALVSRYAAQRGLDVPSAVARVLTWRQQFWTRYRKRHDVPFALEF